MLDFIYGGNTGETPESLARRREIQDALAAQIMGHAPTTALGGLGSILSGLALGYGRYKDNKAETAGRNSASDLFSSLLGGTAPGSTTATPDIPNSTSVPSIPGNIANARTSDRSSVPGYAPAPSMAGLDKNDVYNSFMNTVQGSVKNPYALAAIASTANAESKFSPDNANRTWADPSATDPSAMAGGLMSWNGPRLKNLQAYAASKGEKMGSISPQTQAEFFLNENPQLTSALQNAKSVQEAQSLMNNAWRFKGYNQPGGEAQQRLQSAENFLPKFQSADASTAGQPVQTSQQPVQVADNSNSIPSTTQTAQTTQQPTSALAGVDPNLIKAMMNPWLSAEQRSVIQTMINQQLQNADPMHKMELEKGRLELNALEHPKTARVLTADEKTTAGLPSDGVYQLETDGKITTVREPNKPTSAWVKMDDGRLLNNVTGEIKDLPPEANPAMPEAIKALDARAKASGLKPGTQEYQNFMLNGGDPDSQIVNGQDGAIYSVNKRTNKVTTLSGSQDPEAIRALKARAEAMGLHAPEKAYADFIGNNGQTPSDWERLDDQNLFNKRTGERKRFDDAPGAKFRFPGSSPEAAALNGLIDAGQLTEQQAMQIAAGKSMTGPNGEVIFATPQALMGGQPSQPTQAQPTVDDGNGVNLFPSNGQQQQPVDNSQSNATNPQNPGMIQLTAPQITDSQKNAMTFADRMSKSGMILDNMGMRGTDTPDQMMNNWIPFGLGNYLTSDDFKSVDQAKRDFVNAQLRRESGAVISPGEFDNANKQYFPQPGDPPELVKQKNENRQLVINGMIRAAGPTYKGTYVPPGDKAKGDKNGVPDGVDPKTWQHMTPQERALWQN